MREIKFRGKQKNGGEWIYGYLFCIWQQAYILWGTVNGNPDMKEVIPESVGKFTGIKDKNGKEIYESDLIRDDAGYLWCVAFGKGEFYLYSKEESIRPDRRINERLKYLEVIGNEFESNASLQKNA